MVTNTTGITRQELNPHGHKLTADQARNFERLFDVMNSFRQAYGRPMIVTSGVRSVEEQTRIDGAAGRKPRLGSMHLKAAACDVWDRDRSVWNFCLDNLKLLAELGLYLEDKNSTPSWVHFQILPPRSGNRVFVP